MNYNNVLVIVISFIITISGYYINFIRNKNDSQPISVAKDNSLFIFRLLIPIALLISLSLYFLEKGSISIPNYLIYAGYIFVVFGLVLRWVAVKRLGSSFRVKVSLLKNQKLVTNGIYKKIRHPSYTGLLLYYFGLGIVMQNYLCLALLLFIPIYVVIHRLDFEEKFLLKSFGSVYKNYQKQTNKLVPYFY